MLTVVGLPDLARISGGLLALAVGAWFIVHSVKSIERSTLDKLQACGFGAGLILLAFLIWFASN